MKAFAIFLIVLCLIAAGGIIYTLVTSNLTAVSVSCTLLTQEDNASLYDDIFDKLKSQIEEGSFVGTRFSEETLTTADRYRIYTWTVRVENRTSLPARVAEIQILPLKGYDILQFDMDALAGGTGMPERIIQPNSVIEYTVSVLTSDAIRNASSRADVRDATITWYFSGYPFPETNGKGGRLVLRPK